MDSYYHLCVTERLLDLWHALLMILVARPPLLRRHRRRLRLRHHRRHRHLHHRRRRRRRHKYLLTHHCLPTRVSTRQYYLHAPMQASWHWWHKTCTCFIITRKSTPMESPWPTTRPMQPLQLSVTLCTISTPSLCARSDATAVSYCNKSFRASITNNEFQRHWHRATCLWYVCASPHHHCQHDY
jgi:hypothetical protein